MTQPTNRPVSPGAEAWLSRPPTKVLDHGWVRVVDYMGNDDSIDRSARQSYGDKARSVRDAAHLIDYLMGHQHSSPFEACELTVQIRAPIFVARQWFRHRTASPNEQSARYSTLESDFYLPDLDTMRAQSRANHQGRGDPLPGNLAHEIRDRLDRAMRAAMDAYESATANGLAKELARLPLPVAAYTTWTWKMDLRNWLHLLHLRLDPHAQEETRAYAQVCEDVIQDWVPLAHAAWVEHVRDACTLSARKMGVVRRMLRGETVAQETSGLSARDWVELMAALDGPEGS